MSLLPLCSHALACSWNVPGDGSLQTVAGFASDGHAIRVDAGWVASSTSLAMITGADPIDPAAAARGAR